MGILNITPDSFYDGGKYKTQKDILIQCEKMLSEGVAIIDIGAVSTRPGADKVSKENEITRLLPVLKIIRKYFSEAIISIDTYRSSIAEIVVDTGADIINDISGGNFDDRMFEIIAKLKVPYIMMHIKGTPQNMQQNPKYKNVVKEIKDFFFKKIEELKTIGVNKIIIDPGFGFGKTVEHSYQILNHLDTFKSLGVPVLAGLSRKSMINKVLNTKPKNALNGTTILNTIALLKGADIIRVHDVKEAVEVIKIVSELNESD